MSAPDDLCLALDGLRRGPQAAALAPAWLWIRGGQVEYLAGAPPPELSEHTVRLYGGWAVEPLADAHVHLFLDGSRDPAGRARTAALPRAAALERALSVLRR